MLEPLDNTDGVSMKMEMKESEDFQTIGKNVLLFCFFSQSHSEREQTPKFVRSGMSDDLFGE